jgi:hypothetical protein
LFDQINGVSEMIAVSMRAKQHIQLLHPLFGFRALWIVGDEGVDDNSLAAGGFHPKSGVPQPCQFYAVQIH